MSWNTPTSVTYLDSGEQAFYKHKDLRRVVWGGDSANLEFWALPGAGIQTLIRVAFDPGGNLWITGLCGRVWERSATTSSWVEHKTQTGGNVVGFQFVTENRGYIASFSETEVQQAVVRLNR